MSAERVSLIKQLWRIRLTIISIAAPLVFMPLPIAVPTPAGRCAYAILLMATFWMTEAIPIAVTALLPVVIMPWLSIMHTKDICGNYLKDANMLFFGGLMVAVAVERWNLHKRIALRVLLLVGSKPPWLMFGFMCTTAFLSMWISNTATTAMMVPISQAVLTELNNHRRLTKINKLKAERGGHKNKAYFVDPAEESNDGVITTRFGADPESTGGKEEEHSCHSNSNYSNNHNSKSSDNGNIKTSAEANNNSSTTEKENTQRRKSSAAEKPEGAGRRKSSTLSLWILANDTEEQWFEKVSIGMRLCIAYAANIGGTSTLTGTGPNLVLKGQLDIIYGTAHGVNFSSWFVFAFPNMIISLFTAWIWLMLLFLGPAEMMKVFRRRQAAGAADGAAAAEDSAGDVIRQEYQKLGSMSFAEGAVLAHFIILALMWLTRDPEFVPGWGSLLEKRYVSDSCVAITISVLLFFFPSKMPNYLCFRKKDDDTDPGPATGLLDWPTIHKQMPWNVILLLGGGFALADACQVSGLSAIIGEFFTTFRNLPPWVLALVLSAITATFTEVTSNVATATIVLPILAELSRNLRLNPLYLMMPVTISASFAFMLPVATPPNAIVFAYGKMKILDMMKAGFLMNCMCLLILQVAINTWGYSYFHLYNFPEWAGGGPGANATLSPPLNISAAEI